jgi:hypothetical protein
MPELLGYTTTAKKGRWTWRLEGRYPWPFLLDVRFRFPEMDEHGLDTQLSANCTSAIHLRQRQSGRWA